MKTSTCKPNAGPSLGAMKSTETHHTGSMWTLAELLPALWRVEAEASGASPQEKHPQQEPIKKIEVWTKCFAVYVAL